RPGRRDLEGAAQGGGRGGRGGRRGGDHVIVSLQHVGVLTGDLEAAVDRFSALLGNVPARVVAVDRLGVKLRTAMIPVGNGSGTFVQLIEPERGPGVSELAAGGEGTLYEMAFEVSDIEEARDEAVAAGALPTDLVGEPLRERYLV